jgi:hypothetical protein
LPFQRVHITTNSGRILRSVLALRSALGKTAIISDEMKAPILS